jgi:hypothetical protein
LRNKSHGPRTTADDVVFNSFHQPSQGVWELTLDQPLMELRQGRLTVSIKDRQGNLSRIERVFSVGQ